jgi:hypothetical protein
MIQMDKKTVKRLMEIDVSQRPVFSTDAVISAVMYTILYRVIQKKIIQIILLL